MTALGRAIHEFEQTGPTPQRWAAARQHTLDAVRGWAGTSPVLAAINPSRGQRLPYHELVERVRETMIAGADLPAMLLNDYLLHSRSAQAFRHRLTLSGERLAAEIDARLARGYRPVRVFSLQYLGGLELLSLADNAERVAALKITCIDDNAAALRHGEETLAPRFGHRIAFEMADAARWLRGPTCPRETACVVYAVSALEKYDAKTVARILQGAHALLRDGGTFIAGSVTPNAPVAEQRLRLWLLDWDWRYRSEEEWRGLFAKSPFREENVSYEYEPLGLNLVMTARRAG